MLDYESSDPTRKGSDWKFQAKTNWEIVTSYKNSTLGNTRIWVWDNEGSVWATDCSSLG